MRLCVDVEFNHDARMREAGHSFYADAEDFSSDEVEVILAVRDKLEAIFGRAFSICEFKVKDVEALIEKVKLLRSRA